MSFYFLKLLIYIIFRLVFKVPSLQVDTRFVWCNNKEDFTMETQNKNPIRSVSSQSKCCIWDSKRVSNRSLIILRNGSLNYIQRLFRFWIEHWFFLSWNPLTYEPETILQRVSCINSSSPVVDNYMNECNTVLCVLSLRLGSAMTYIGFHVTTSQTTPAPARSFTGTCCGLQVVIFIGSERARMKTARGYYYH